ncbi:MAG: hypothetical protein IPJ08_14180 [Burkholderiales bacterium]|nr:hypothetical protein [Burkholderiales bacterium]
MPRRCALASPRPGLAWWTTIALMEKHFWEADAGLDADEATRDWHVLPLPRPERQHARLRGFAGGV